MESLSIDVDCRIELHHFRNFQEFLDFFNPPDNRQINYLIVTALNPLEIYARDF